MIVTNAEKIHLLQVYTNEKERDTQEASAFIDGMQAAFKLVNKKLKEENKDAWAVELEGTL